MGKKETGKKWDTEKKRIGYKNDLKKRRKGERC